jgi:hypothetical protein
MIRIRCAFCGTTVDLSRGGEFWAKGQCGVCGMTWQAEVHYTPERGKCGYCQTDEQCRQKAATSWNLMERMG